jgi:hypothetical protein
MPAKRSKPAARVKLPKLPSLLDRKIYKTGQTRGADDDVLFQNRVSRNSTVLIPYSFWSEEFRHKEFEKGFIVLISPTTYLSDPGIQEKLAHQGLVLGENLLVFYETRQQWNAHNPEQQNWTAATSRIAPLGGQYAARVPATTAVNGGGKIIRGFSETSNKGAGIRIFEYADASTVKDCRDQLEALFWLCADSESVAVTAGMSEEDTNARKSAILEDCKTRKLLDLERLMAVRMINEQGHTVCPLCLEELSGNGFINRMEQAEGREVPDLTVTQINLFHIEELRINSFNHKPYNLGWGHHHCNVVVKDSGITKTIEWMREILKRNKIEGHFNAENKGS